jgi:hypothetical protein
VRPQGAPGGFTLDEVDAQDQDDNPLVNCWHTTDEPDMFADLAYVQSLHATFASYDDGRFTSLNVGKGLLGLTFWQPLADVHQMLQIMDVNSADMYAYSAVTNSFNEYISSPFWPGSDDPADAQRAATYGWTADLLRSHQDPENLKPYGVVVETGDSLSAQFGGTGRAITLPEITGAAWSAIRHQARYVLFFQHNSDGVSPFYSVTDQTSTAVRGQVTATTTEVHDLAEVIDGPTYTWDFGTSDVDTLLKAFDGFAYIFAGVSITAPFPGRGDSDIEQLGTTLQFQISDTSDSGTVSSTITVPADTELVVVGVSGLHGTANGFDAMTFTKGATDATMTKVTGGDASGASWQSAMFYLDEPDIGASKSLKWNWSGVASNGALVVAVTFWRGVDLNNPVRDGDGVQDTGFALETPILIETSDVEIADGDKVLAFCGMRNPGADGTAKVNTWHHATGLQELTHSGIAEAALATGSPDGDCTIGVENISVATEAAIIAAVIKAATLEAVTSTVEQTGSLFRTTGSASNTGTFFGTFTVPGDCTLVLAGVIANANLDGTGVFETVSMMKGGVMTPMVKLESADKVHGWMTALFYMVNPDVGAGLTADWDWIGTDPIVTDSQLTLTFWKGVDTADPIRDSAATSAQIEEVPVETPMLTNREGDLVVAYFGFSTTGSANGAVTAWKNLTTLDNPTNNSFLDCAWATTSVIGSLRVGVDAVTNLDAGALCAVVLKPLAAVTPITPAADPPTTPRTVVTGTFTLPPDLAAATTVEVIGESRSISVTAGVFTDDFDEEWTHHNYKVEIP